MAKCAVGSLTAAFIKWLDFLGAFSFAFFGCILCAIIMVNPFMLMTPPIAIGMAVGFIVVPVYFKALSSMLIQGGMHSTWSLLYWTAVIYICFIVSFGAVLVLKVRPVLQTVMNPEVINHLKDCIMSIISGKAGNMLDSQLSAATANVTGQLNTATANLANAASPAVAVHSVATNMNPATGRVV